MGLIGKRPAGQEPRGLRFLVGFFSITLILMLLKRFGSPLINWIGDLPVSEMVLYVKYQEPVIAVCVSVLAGIGFSRVSERRVSRVAVGVAVAIILVAMLGWTGSYWKDVPAVKGFRFFYYGSLAAGIAVEQDGGSGTAGSIPRLASDQNAGAKLSRARSFRFACFQVAGGRLRSFATY